MPGRQPHRSPARVARLAILAIGALSALFVLAAWWSLPAGAQARLFLPIARRATSPDVGRLDTWTLPAGTVRAAAWSGDYLVASIADRLYVLDLADAAGPTAVGSADVPAAHRIRVRDGVAYVAAWGELLTVDISDPTAPHVTGRLTGDPDSGAWDVDLASTFAVVAAWRETLTVDVRDPANPAVLGRVETPPVAGAVAVAGDIAVVTSAPDFAGAVHLVDVSTPTRPTLLATHDLPMAVDVVARGSFAYVAANGIATLNIADPASPRLVSTEPSRCPDPVSIAVVGESLAAACLEAGAVQLYALTDPARPVPYDSGGAGRIALPPAVDTSSIAAAGDQVAASVPGYGVWVIDASAPASPRATDRFEVVGRPQAATGDGSHAFVADWFGGLRIIDVAQPGRASVVASVYEAHAYCRAVAVAGRHAFQSCGTGTREAVRVYDVGDPLAPRLVARLDTGAGRLAATDRLLVLARQSGSRVGIADISDPTAPRMLGDVPTAGPVSDVAVAGVHAYIATAPASLWIADLSDPDRPRLVSSASLGGYPERLVVDGTTAVVLTRDARVVLLDVSRPDRPRELTRTEELGGLGRGLAVARGIGYVLVWDEVEPGTYAGRLVFLDLTAPERPRDLGSIAAPVGTDAAVVGSVVLTGSERGLQLVRTIR